MRTRNFFRISSGLGLQPWRLSGQHCSQQESLGARRRDGRAQPSRAWRQISLCLQGVVFPVRPSFHLGVCPSGTGGSHVLSSATGWVVTLAPGLESKIFPIRFPRSAGNLHRVFYCRTLQTRRGLPLLCSAVCNGDVAQSSQRGLVGFWSPSRRPAHHRQCQVASASCPKRGDPASQGLYGPTKQIACLSLDVEMLTVAKTEACNDYSRLTWEGCSVPVTPPLDLSHTVNLHQRWKTGVVRLPLLSHWIKSGWASLSRLCSHINSCVCNVTNFQFT